MIVQLRPFHSARKLKQVYANPYRHDAWEDHRLRVAVTIHIARWMRDHIGATSGADLSAGDGAVLRGCHLDDSLYGDYRIGAHPGDERWVATNIEETKTWDGITADLYICSETIEHVRCPAQLLHRARKASRALVLSTPVGELGDHNPEHYWGWEAEDMETLLDEAGFDVVSCTLLDPHVPGGYTYQIWGCT